MSINKSEILRKYLDFNSVILGKPYNTIRSIRNDLNQFITFLNEENKQFSDVDQMVIRSYIMHLNSNKQITKRTISRSISSIRTFYKYLLKNDYITENQVQYISPPKFEKPLPTYISDDEVDKIRQVIDTSNILGIRDRAMLETLYSSGIRSMELLDLSENAINFEENQIKVLGKADKERITFISPTAKKWILKYIEKKKQELSNYTTLYIFCNNKGQKLTTRTLRRIVEKYSKLAGIEKEVSPHTLRHSFATKLLNEKIDIKYVQELLGHSSLSTTQVYTHVSKEQLKKIYNTIHPLATKEINEKK